MAEDTLELPADPQVEANGYLQEVAGPYGTPFRLVAAPVQYGGSPATPTRAPAFNEHCEDILSSIGLSDEEIIELKVAGVVA